MHCASSSRSVHSWARQAALSVLLPALLPALLGACTAPSADARHDPSADAAPAPDLALPPDLGAADLRAAPDLRDPKAAATIERGAIVRGPRDQKVLAVMYTGGDYADGGTPILNELGRRGIKASFFFTGDFLRRAEYKTLIERIRDEGHYIGAHSDKHLEYASDDSPPKLLVTRAEFEEDVTRNLIELERFGIARSAARVFLPPFEQYTPEIAAWTRARGMLLINYSEGTSSNADYLEDTAPNFISADAIVKSILAQEERARDDGLRGFLLLMHIGVGPDRKRDRLYDRLGALLDELARRGYRFARVDELLPMATWPPAP